MRLVRASNRLLHDAFAKIRVDEAFVQPIDRTKEASNGDAVLLCELVKARNCEHPRRHKESIPFIEL